jgi:ankyrin repeat domain-containing protein 50
LHASLQLDALRECFSLGEVRRVIEAFPSTIEAVYLHTWHRILQRNPTRVELAKYVLLWVLYAARPMTLGELEWAVATCPETYKFQPNEVVPGMNLVALCRGLVTLEEESGVVRLVRKSIGYFFNLMLTYGRLYSARNATTTSP